MNDSSEEEGAHVTSPLKAEQGSSVPRVTSVSVSTQTRGTMLDLIQTFAESSFLTVVDMNPIRNQFWASILACMKTPRGGVNGGGSMRCSFEFDCASEAVVKYLMEDLPCAQNQRYNLSTPSAAWDPPVYWEKSPSISTYHIELVRTLDSYFRLHRRLAARGRPTYRGSLLLNPPDDHPASVCLLSAAPPFLVEYCQRKHGKLVLAVSFFVTTLNDQNFQALSPVWPYATGMDALLKQRALNHVKKIHLKGFSMSSQFVQLAGGHLSTAPQSEGEWDPPPQI